MVKSYKPMTEKKAKQYYEKYNLNKNIVDIDDFIYGVNMERNLLKNHLDMSDEDIAVLIAIAHFEFDQYYYEKMRTINTRVNDEYPEGALKPSIYKYTDEPKKRGRKSKTERKTYTIK